MSYKKKNKSLVDIAACDITGVHFQIVRWDKCIKLLVLTQISLVPDNMNFLALIHQLLSVNEHSKNMFTTNMSINVLFYSVYSTYLCIEVTSLFKIVK